MMPSHGLSSVHPILCLGRYAIFGEIASGGMASVHFGRMSAAAGFHKTVAIKRLHPSAVQDPQLVATFLDEARLASRVEHPNVVATLDVVAESGEVFVVTEYIRGESLQRLRMAAINRQEHVPIPIAVSIVAQMLAGLHAAHEATDESGALLGIVHRDVSPQNVLVGEDGVARITDFGLVEAESRFQITSDGRYSGKLPYMAPEQLDNSDGTAIDLRVDIYAAAVVLWELIAGRCLFSMDHPGTTIAMVSSGAIPALTPLRPGIPPALESVVQRALRRNPTQRHCSAEQFAYELEDALQGVQATSRTVGAWVSSLATEALANRLRYVREMGACAWSTQSPDRRSLPHEEMSQIFAVVPPSEPTPTDDFFSTPRPPARKKRYNLLTLLAKLAPDRSNKVQRSEAPHPPTHVSATPPAYPPPTFDGPAPHD